MWYVRMRGLKKARDRTLKFGRLTLLAARNNKGKSSILDTIRFVALGFVPALGKTLASSAKLMPGREMQVEIGDLPVDGIQGGVVIKRTLTTTPEGGLTLDTDCSTMRRGAKGDPGPSEHANEAVRLFGVDQQTAAECLDFRQLADLSGPQRIARIEKFLAGDADPAEVEVAIVHSTVRRLVGLREDNMPADYLQVIGAVDGFDQGGDHRGAYAWFKRHFAMLRAKLRDVSLTGGLGPASDWVSAEKRRADSEVASKKKARNELSADLEGIAEPDGDEIARLELRRGDIEQALGAARERVDAAERLLGKIALADRTVAARQSEADEAVRVRAGFEERSGTLAAARARLAEVDAEIAALTQPVAVELAEIPALEAGLRNHEASLANLQTQTPAAPPRDALDAQSTRITELEAAHSAVVVPEPVSVFEEEEALASAQSKLRQAASEPYLLIAAEATKGRELSGRVPKSGRAISIVFDTIIALAKQHGPQNIAELEAAATEAEQLVTAKRRQRDQVARVIEETTARRAALARDVAEAKQALRDLTAAYERDLQTSRLAHEATRASIADLVRTVRGHLYLTRLIALVADGAAILVYAAQRDALAAERTTLAEQLEPIAEADKDSAEDVATTRAALIAAKDVRAALGDAPDAVKAVSQELRDELTTVAAQLGALLQARSNHELLKAKIEEIRAAEAESFVLSALERACADARSKVVDKHRGPLVAFLDRYLKGAGRPEGAYVESDKSNCDFGWLDTEGDRVSIATMAGGDLTIFAAGMVAALQVLRKVPIRILLVEASECDEITQQQLLAGIGSIADELTAAIVAQWYRPASLPAGWVAMTPDGETLDLPQAQAA